jgi:hypothetical protein
VWVATGDNPGRVRTEAGFAALCGASPVDASSSKQIRHRLNRGGDRQANSALWTITMTRLAHDPRTKAYLARRTAEGKTKREIIRCLKRYIAREVYKTLCRPQRPDRPPAPRVKQDLLAPALPKELRWISWVAATAELSRRVTKRPSGKPGSLAGQSRLLPPGVGWHP